MHYQNPQKSEKAPGSHNHKNKQCPAEKKAKITLTFRKIGHINSKSVQRSTKINTVRTEKLGFQTYREREEWQQMEMEEP